MVEGTAVLAMDTLHDGDPVIVSIVEDENLPKANVRLRIGPEEGTGKSRYVNMTCNMARLVSAALLFAVEQSQQA